MKVPPPPFNPNSGQSQAAVSQADLSKKKAAQAQSDQMEIEKKREPQRLLDKRGKNSTGFEGLWH